MKRRSFDDSGHAHYLTFSCYRRQRLLTDDLARAWLAESIDRARKIHNFRLWAWVIMPEHVHLLLHPVTETYFMTQILQSIKGPFARRIIAHWRETAPHKSQRIRVVSGKKTGYRFWQAGDGFDRNLFQMARITRAIEYIEYNPVRRGLVPEAKDWRWSSAWARAGKEDPLLLTDTIDLDNEEINRRS